MKKLLSVLIIALLIAFPAFAVDAFAQTNSITVAGDAVTAAPGEKVQLTLSLTKNTGVAGLTASLKYDTDVFSLTEAKNGGLFSGFSFAKNIVWDEASDVTTTGTLAAFTFEVAKDAADGDYAIEIIPRSCTNVALENVECSVTSGTITVDSSCKHANAYEITGRVPTCWEVGLSAGFFCPDCNTWLTPQQEIPKKEHVFTELTSDETDHWVKCANCDAISGKEAHTGGTATCLDKAVCTRCRKEYGELAAHDYAKTTTKATLSKAGKIETKCSVCGEISSTSSIAYPKTITLSSTKLTYTGKAQKPTVTVKDSKGKAVASSNYTLKYSANTSVGTGKVTVTFKGNYSGTKTLTFTIAPKQVTGLKAATVKTTSIKLSWSKVTGAKYYKVERSTDGKKWTVLTSAATTNSYTASKLTAGKKYQFRITALDSTKKIAGAASAVLKTGTLTAAPSVALKSSKAKTAAATWKKVTGASKYTVYKSTDAKKWTKVTTTTKLTYTLTKLTGGKKIYVKVTAVNAYGKASADSALKSVKVKK